MSINYAVLRGTLSSDPEIRTLASGTTLATVQLTTRSESGPAMSVPVSIADPSEWVTNLVAGDSVVVIGSIRRRFFRAGGATASRVEVEATDVIRAGDKRAMRRIVRHAQRVVDELTEPAA